MSGELTRVEQARLYLSMIDALSVSVNPATPTEASREATCWGVAHLTSAEYLAAWLLADVIRDHFRAQRITRCTIDLETFSDLAVCDDQTARTALGLLGFSRVARGTYSNDGPGAPMADLPADIFACWRSADW